MDTELIIVISIFITGMLMIYIEAKLNYPFGKFDIVLCPIPPFIKRIKIAGHWFGFDKNWKFLLFKKDV